MKKFYYLIVALALMTACTCGDATKDPSEAIHQDRDGVFIHISSADPHRALMALQMAEMMAADRDVMVYFDINGIELTLDY